MVSPYITREIEIIRASKRMRLSAHSTEAVARMSEMFDGVKREAAQRELLLRKIPAKK